MEAVDGSAYMHFLRINIGSLLPEEYPAIHSVQIRDPEFNSVFSVDKR
jgi:hypothetical protein